MRVPEPEAITFTCEQGTIQGVLKKISATGGLASLPRQIAQSTFAEVRVKTIRGPVEALVEMFEPRVHLGAPEQGFKFIAMSDDDHERLNGVLKEMMKKKQGAA